MNDSFIFTDKMSEYVGAEAAKSTDSVREDQGVLPGCFCFGPGTRDRSLKLLRRVRV